MDPPQTGNGSPGYPILVEDACTQTNDRDIFIQEQTRDASTQTADEITFPERTRERDPSTQTPEDDSSLLEQPPATPKTSEESGKLKISNVQNITHGSDNCKLTETEIERKHPRCSVCKTTDSEHLEVRFGDDLYKCCRCLLRTTSFKYLRMHAYLEHFEPFYCKVCEMKYSDTGSHARGGTCYVCKENFECIHQLKEHHFIFKKNFVEQNA